MIIRARFLPSTPPAFRQRRSPKKSVSDIVYWQLPLPPVPKLGFSDAGSLLDVVLNADEAESARIIACHRLRGLMHLDDVAGRRDVARRLVPVLNEPLLWLGSEAHAVLGALGDTLAIGVDGHGLLAASPEAEASLERDADGQRHCPTLGPVEAMAHVGTWATTVAGPLPWLAAPSNGGVLFAVHDAQRFIRKVWVQTSCTLGAGSFTVRLPGKARVSVEFQLLDGVASIRQGYAGPGPTMNGGARLGRDWRSIGVGDVVGMDPWRLRVLVIVPPLSTDTRDGGPDPTDRLIIEHTGRPPDPLRVGGVSWSDRFVGHVVALGSGRLGLVDLERFDARIIQVGPRAVVVDRPDRVCRIDATWSPLNQTTST
jgi:hypothetical protein